ncbi:MAG: serine/threonine protein kinase [Planctomycetota bacterium]|jgi:serine/threonine protein kinase
MAHNRDDRIRELFNAALEKDTAEREAWVRTQCGEDSSIADSVLGLLAAEPDATGFLEPPILLTRAEDLIGATLGDFTLTGILGSGGMGIVYRADQTHLEQPVAVKVVHPHLVAEPEVVIRFQREVRLTASLRHPCIVRVLAAGEDRGLHWYAMELIHGQSLAVLMRLHDKRLHDKRLHDKGLELPSGAPDLSDPRAIAELGATLLEALDFAHEHDIVHRDVKPGNVLIDPDGRIYLGDFGLARDLTAGPTGATRSGLVAGTLAYMSPEQARQLKDAIDRRTDIYSAAAVLYELLTGEPPYGGLPSLAMLASLDSPEVRPLRSHLPKVDRNLALCIERGLRRNPDQRYANAGTFAKDLRAWLAGTPISARPLSLGQRLRNRSRSRRFILRASAAAIGLSLVAGVFAWRTADQVRARSSWASIEIDASALPPGSRLGYSLLSADPSKPAETIQAKPLSPRGATLSIPPGPLRLQIELPGGQLLELDRIPTEEQVIKLRPEPPRTLPAGIEWVAFGGGEESYAIRLESGYNVTHSISVGPFHLSRAPITNGQVELYLRQSGRTLLQFGGEAYTQAKGTRSGDDWSSLPATLINHSEATAIAEWWGYRLPSTTEWTHALNSAKSQADSVPARPDYPAQGPPWLLDPEGNQSSPLAYARFIEPARALAEGFPLQMAGASEWTCTPMPREIAGRLNVDTNYTIARGLPWHRTDNKSPWVWLDQHRRAPEFDTSADLGFRLAHSN